MTEQIPDRMNNPAVIGFLKATNAFASAMIPSFSFVAFRRNGRWELFRARLTLNLPGFTPSPVSLRTAQVIAGRELVTTTSDARLHYIDAMLSGAVEVAGEKLHFDPNFDGNYGRTFIPLHPDGIAQQNRVSVLQLLGSDQNGYFPYAPLDWELRAAAEPYDGLNDLLNALGLPSSPNTLALFEAIAFQVATIDAGSNVMENQAHMLIRLAKGLSRTDASIGYRVLSGGSNITRGTIHGSNLDWSDDGDGQLGEVKIDVPPASVMQAYACFEGVAYHHWWFNDPAHSQNPRRAAYEVADPGFQTLRSFLYNTGKQARDLEYGVAWLFWMLGFNPAHLGANSRMADAADILMTTPQGHFAVVECTTGVLKAEHKLTLLIDRTVAIKTKLALSNYSQLKVLPVIFTTKTRAEIHADIDQARELGVIVVTRDHIDPLINRTLLLPTPDAIYAEAEKSLQGSSGGNTEPELPFQN